jgi:hypothetical protein
MSYTNVVICIGPLLFLETWPPIYRGQERTLRDGLKASQVHHHVYFRYTLCLTNFTFEFIRRPAPPIISPSYWTFVELTLVSKHDNKSTLLVQFQTQIYHQLKHKLLWQLPQKFHDQKNSERKRSRGNHK